MSLKNESDRGMYCPYCHTRVPLDPRQHVVRTVTPSDLRPGGKQYAHAACAYTHRVPIVLRMYPHLLPKKDGQRMHPNTYLKVLRGSRYPLQRLVDDLWNYVEYWHGAVEPLNIMDVVDIGKALADLIGTDQLDPTIRLPAFRAGSPMP